MAILFAHNNARWDLGPNQKEKVDTDDAQVATPNTEITAAITKETSAMKACLDTATLAVVLEVFDGKASFAYEGQVSARTKACLAKIAGRIKVPNSETPYSVKLTLAK